MKKKTKKTKDYDILPEEVEEEYIVWFWQLIYSRASLLSCQRRCGGIGRHERLKISFPLGSIGSSPVIGTICYENITNCYYVFVNWMYYYSK